MGNPIMLAHIRQTCEMHHPQRLIQTSPTPVKKYEREKTTLPLNESHFR